MHLERSIEDIFIQINRVRHSPHDYAHHHQDIESQYNGKIYRGRFKTREGPKAAKDLLYDLKSRHNIEHPLKWSFGLHMLADEKARILGENDLSTTEGTRFHRSLPDRAGQYAVLKGKVSEVVDFGADNPEEVIESILIDDGLGSRKRRATLLDPIYQYAGVGTALHSQYGVVVVIILAEDVVSLVAPGQEGYFMKRQAIEQGQVKTVKIQHRRANQPDRMQRSEVKYQVLNKVMVPRGVDQGY